MENLIKALNIFLKYGNPRNPTHCEHDMLMICGYNATEIIEDDKVELEALGFHFSEEYDCFVSYRYGSA